MDGVRAWWSWLWHPRGDVEDFEEEHSPTTTVTVAVRSPTKGPLGKRPATAAPSEPIRRQPKRGGESHHCATNVMNDATERIACAKEVQFDAIPEQGGEAEDADPLGGGILRVWFPQRGNRTKAPRRCEDYPWVASKDHLCTVLALHGLANENATLLTLAMDYPGYFWNAVYWCEGDVSRIEKEILAL